jgi:hypothetical protein
MMLRIMEAQPRSGSPLRFRRSNSTALQFAEKLCFWVAQRFTAAISRLF